MSRSCSTDARDEECIHFSRETCVEGKDNVQLDLKEINCDNLDWIHLAQNRVKLCDLYF
jgi:hypothetical protein